MNTRLHFIPDAGAALDLEGARPRPGERLEGEAGRGEMADGFNDARLGGVDRGAALVQRAEMLPRAMIGLQAGEAEIRTAADLRGELARRSAGRNAAAARADIDFDQHVDLRAGPLRRIGQKRDRLGLVDADANAGLTRQVRQAPDLARADDLIGDEHISDAAGDKRFRLGHFLAADADRTQGNLPPGNERRLVRLGMRAQAHAEPFHERGHLFEIARQSIEIDDQGGSVDLRHGCTNFGREQGWHSSDPDSRFSNKGGVAHLTGLTPWCVTCRWRPAPLAGMR
jgi:hypothetical protein